MQVSGKADQIMSGMVEWLKSGKLSVGDKLPNEKALAKMFGVSLHTVNKAMSRLEDAALISRSTGAGTHVINVPADDAIAVVCDMKHLSESFHAPSNDKLIEDLIGESRKRKLIPHFLVGRGRSADEYFQSLGVESGVWREIKGVVSYGWREGLVEKFQSKGIPLVVLSTKEQGVHAITLDYVELGRLAARRLLECGAKRICALYHKELDGCAWNNPLLSFKEELSKASFDSEGLRLLESGANPDDSFRASASFERELLSADGIFITDDNVALGFARWLEAKRPSLKAGLKIITQASKGVDLGLPGSFERISFDLSELAEKALDTLGELRGGKMDSLSPSRTWIKPKLEISRKLQP